MDTASTRKVVRVWMREVMRDKGWTAAEWARRAGTSPTNITRVLSPTADIISKASTLSRLASAAGTQPQLAGIANVQPPAITVPLLTCGELAAVLSKGNIWDWVEMNVSAFRKIQVDRAHEGPAFALEIEGDGMEGRGLVAGDRILVQKSVEELSPGMVVVAEHEGRVLVGEWGFRCLNFRPPHNRAAEPRYHPVPERNLRIVGRAVSLIRDL